MKSFRLLFLGLMIMSIVSCVSSKKYKDLKLLSDYYKTENDRLRVAEEEKISLAAEQVNLRSTIRQNKADMEEMSSRLNSLEKSNKDYLQRYEDLLHQNKDLLQITSGEIKTLTEELSSKRDELDQRTRSLDSLQTALASQEKNLGVWRQRVEELESALAEKDAKMTALRSKINEALLGFSSNDLSVTEQNGKLYVSLSQNLLFKSGSDKIDANGVKAIQQVAQVLNTNPDIEITVEGHTDSDGTADSNWDLSVSRATSVVKILTANQVDPKRITASGRALYLPIIDNDSAENKAKNRRVEVILSPKLDELYQIMKN